MNKKEFVALFAEKANFESKAEAERKLDALLGAFEEVLVKGEFSTKIKIACVKCLEDYEKEIKGQIESVYLDSKVLKEYANSFEEEAESDENFYEEIIDGTIDVSELVREHLILEIDPYGVCSDKCEGLEEMKNYEDNGVDPRWAQILEMSKNK